MCLDNIFVIMNLGTLKECLRAYADIIRQQNHLYSKSGLKQDLYRVQKVKQIGMSVFNCILIDWVYLQHNMNQEGYQTLRKICIARIRKETGCQFKVVIRVIGKLHVEKRFQYLMGIEAEIQSILMGCQLISHSAQNRMKKYNLGYQERWNIFDLYQQDEDDTKFKTFLDDFSIVMEAQDNSLKQVEVQDFGVSVWDLGDKYRDGNKQNICWNGLSRASQVDVELYLDQSIKHVSAELSELLQYLGFGNAVFKKCGDQTLKYTTHCIVETPRICKRPLQRPLYESIGTGTTLKLAKAQAARKILLSLYSQNQGIWRQFTFKKNLRGVLL